MAEHKFDRVFPGLKFFKEKESGANDPGEYGGVYQDLTDETILYMVKREKDMNKNISEFAASQLFEDFSPGRGAKVSLIVPTIADPADLRENGSGVYVKSEFFKNYKDLAEDLQELDRENRPIEWWRINGRPGFMGTQELIWDVYSNAFQQQDYKGFAEIAPVSLLLKDFDIHPGNIGVIGSEFFRIDFAESLRALTEDINPHSYMRHLPGFGPTNHYREFPDDIKYNHEFADTTIAKSRKNIAEAVDRLVDQITPPCTVKERGEWAKYVMPKQFKKISPEQITPQDIKREFTSILGKRQLSLRRYAIEIKLGLLVNQQGRIDEQGLKELMHEHPSYFEDLITKKTKLKIRKDFKDISFFETNYPILSYIISRLYPFKRRHITNKLSELITKTFELLPEEQSIPLNNEVGISSTNHLNIQRHEHLEPELQEKVQKAVQKEVQKAVQKAVQEKLQEEVQEVTRALKTFIPKITLSPKELTIRIHELCEEIKKEPAIDGKNNLITQWLNNSKNDLTVLEQKAILSGVLRRDDLIQEPSKNIASLDVAGQQNLNAPLLNAPLSMAGNTKLKSLIFSQISSLTEETKFRPHRNTKSRLPPRRG